jgi:hypothetical protein
MLIDVRGVLVGSTFTQSRSQEQLMPVVARLGVNLAEKIVASTSPEFLVLGGQS